MFTSGGGDAFCPNGVLIHQRDKKDFSVARVICRSGSLSPSRLRAGGCITVCGAWRPRSRKSTKTLKRFRLGRSGNSSSARKCRALVATLISIYMGFVGVSTPRGKQALLAAYIESRCLVAPMLFK
jgi:hypothetical protein